MPRDISGLPAVPEGVSQEVYDFLVSMRKAVIRAQMAQVAVLAGATSGSGVGSPAPVPAPGPPGPPGSYTPDLTPPPTPSGVVVSAGIDFVFITTDAPTFTEGNGYQRTLVYGVTYSGTGPLPTFGDAVLVHEFVGQVGSFAAEPGVQWHIWLKWLTRDNVLSVSPQGGANGNQVTTALIGNANLGPLIIEAGNLAAGAVTAAKFAAGIEPVSIVGALPSPSGYTGPKTVLLTTDGKLYRYVSGAWTTAVAAVDISGQITGTQITDGSVTTPKIAANAVTAAQIQANTITANEIAANAITSSELAANSVIAGKIAAAAVSSTEIAATAIQAVHLAANSIAVGTAAVQNGAIVNAMIADAAITNAKIVSLAASKLTAGRIAVGEYIQSSDFVDGVSGWMWGGNTGQVGSAMIRGLLTAAQIDTRNLDIRDGAGTIIFSASQALDWNRIGGTLKPKVFRALTIGAGASGYPSGLVGLTNAETGASLFSVSRSYNLVLISRSTGVVTFSRSYDVYGTGAIGGFTASDLASDLNSATSASVVVLYSFDEPLLNRTTGGLPAAIYRNGGTRGKFESPLFQSRGAYMLIAYGGCGEGNALFESYAGLLPFGTDGPDDAWIDTTFSLVNGNAIVGGAPLAGFKLDAANISTYIASAAIGSAYISDLSANKITAGNIQAGQYIRSTAYTPGSVGWSINADGTAEFGAASIRGQLSAGNIVGATIKTSSAGIPLTLTGGEALSQSVPTSPVELTLEIPNVGDTSTVSADFSGQILITTSAFGGSGADYFWTFTVSPQIDFWDGGAWSVTELGPVFNERFITTVLPSESYRLPFVFKTVATNVSRTLSKARLRMSVTTRFSTSVAAGNTTANVMSTATLLGDTTIQQFPN